MARVDLDMVWINAQAADGTWSDALGLDSVSRLSRSSRDRDEVRVTASGRVRFVRMPGVVRTWDIVCALLSGDDLDWLILHARELVCVRDPRGRKAFGKYSDPSEDVIAETVDFYSVSLTFTEITHSEVV